MHYSRLLSVLLVYYSLPECIVAQAVSPSAPPAIVEEKASQVKFHGDATSCDKAVSSLSSSDALHLLLPS